MSTNLVTLFRLGTSDEARVRRAMADSDLAWTVAAPGQPSYLLSHLIVQGPDGRSFRFTDVPASTIVAGLAADTLAEYPGQDIARATVTDRVQTDGQGERLSPEATLDDAGVRDGDRLRIGFEAWSEEADYVRPTTAYQDLPPTNRPARVVAPDAPAEIEVAIRSGLAPGKFSVEVMSSHVGEASETVDLDVEALLAQRERLQWAVLASAVPSRRVLPETERPVREIGQLLFTRLLGTGEVAGRYRAAAALAAERGQRLRVVLRIDASELAALPWEAMYDKTVDRYVCRQNQLVRHVRVASVPAPLPVQPPLRILGVLSSPRGLPALDIEKEQDALARALEWPVRRGDIDFHWAPEATWSGLHNLLLDKQEQWHVVHFVGHGDFDESRDEGYLALVKDDGRVDRVAANRLIDLLNQANPMPRLVVLNSCAGAAASSHDLFSSTAAALVRGGISAVAAMQYAISDSAATAFARGFYTAISHGHGVDEAVSAGRIAILGASDSTLEWLTPVLHLRGRDAHLFAISPGSSPRPA
jgi:hypothetical protein